MRRFLMPLAAAAALVAACTASPALAQLKGCYVGAHVGGAITDNRADAGALLKDGGAVTTGLAGAQLGCNVPMGQSMFAGLEVSGDLHALPQGSGPVQGTSGAAPRESLAVIARAGYMVNPSVAAYVGGGYGWGWVSDISAGSFSLGLPVQKTPIALAGLEFHLSPRTTMDLRYRADFNASELNVGGPPSVHLDSVTHSVRLGWSFYFQPDTEPAKAARKAGAP